MKTAPTASSDRETCERRITVLYGYIKLWRHDPEQKRQVVVFWDNVNWLLEEHHERWPG